MGLKTLLEGIEIDPDVMVTGSADATRGTLAPRIAAARKTRKKRSGLFMAPLQTAIGLVLADLR
jgi:hypothetical protein